MQLNSSPAHTRIRTTEMKMRSASRSRSPAVVTAASPARAAERQNRRERFAVPVFSLEEACFIVASVLGEGMKSAGAEDKHNNRNLL